MEGGAVEVKGKWEVRGRGGRVIVELGTLRFCLVLPWLIEYGVHGILVTLRRVGDGDDEHELIMMAV